HPLDLLRGRDRRHEDRALYPKLGAGEGDALGVVPGARTNDSAAPIFVGERTDLVVGATDLERPYFLQVLALYEHGGVELFGEPLGRLQWRPGHDAVEPPRRLVDGRDKVRRFF